MKNTLALTALAIAIAAPSTALATDVKFGGHVQVKLPLIEDISIDGEDVDNDFRSALAAGDVRLNASAEETVGGLTGFVNVQLNMDTLNEGAIYSTDGVRVGIKGDFGTVKFGAADDVNFGRYAGDIAGEGIGNSQSFGYTNTFGTVNVGALYALEPNEANADPDGKEGRTAIGASTAIGSLNVGASYGTGIDDRIIVGVGTDLGDISVGAHYYSQKQGDNTDNVIAAKASGAAGVWSWGVTVAALTSEQGDLEGEGTNIRLNLGTKVAGLNFDFEANQNNGSVEDVDGSETNAVIKLGRSF